MNRSPRVTTASDSRRTRTNARQPGPASDAVEAVSPIVVAEVGDPPGAAGMTVEIATRPINSFVP